MRKAASSNRCDSHAPSRGAWLDNAAILPDAWPMSMTEATNPPDEVIAALLRRRPRVALVGASDKPNRPSFGVMRFLLEHGFDVVPVNPLLAGGVIQGQMVVAGLAEAGALDMVDVFRRSEDTGPVVEEAWQLGAQAVWLQLGVVNAAAAIAARAAGALMIQDRCPAIEWPRLALSDSP